MTAVRSLPLSRRRLVLGVALGVVGGLLPAGGRPARAQEQPGTAPQGAADAAAGGDATAPVEALHAALLVAMQRANDFGLLGRYGWIEKTAREVFDFRRMARLVSGAAWREAEAEARDALAEAFSRNSIATYAKRFDGWSGQRFETLGTEPGPRGAALVKTRLVNPGGEPVALTYVVSPDDRGAWRVIDVLLQGSISELAVKRSEYAGLLASGGLPALTQALTAQAERSLALPR